mmetsp:Transcript_10749/g.28188  ORF Transcript_10749/g.28188 Transcript_10749/m.28188 type:complete len:113 (+) Transcript_10749:370-708(+)
MDESGFGSVQEHQKLMVEFPEYAPVLTRMLNNAINEPSNFLAMFVVDSDGVARLDFIQNMEYKFVELLSCHFVVSPDDVVRQSILYRYNSMKVRFVYLAAFVLCIHVFDSQG